MWDLSLAPVNNIAILNRFTVLSRSLNWNQHHRGITAIAEGKWYFEVVPTTYNPSSFIAGITNSTPAINSLPSGSTNGYGAGMSGSPLKWHNSISVTYGQPVTQGSRFGVALNLIDGELSFYLNSVNLGVAYTGIGAGPWLPWANPVLAGGAIKIDTTPEWTPDGFGRWGENYSISGTVTDDTGAPAKRIVRAYLRESGELICERESDESTGFYRLPLEIDGEMNRVVLDDDAGTVYNDLIARVVPG